MILDEPTNHLDIQSRGVLVDALNRYNGTFVVVSHDRLFLDRVSNKVWYAEKGKVVTYPGNYSEFRYHQGLRESGEGAAPAADNGRPATLETDAGSGPADKKPALTSARRPRGVTVSTGSLPKRGLRTWRTGRTCPRASSGPPSRTSKIRYIPRKKRIELEDFLADPITSRTRSAPKRSRANTAR